MPQGLCAAAKGRHSRQRAARVSAQPPVPHLHRDRSCHICTWSRCRRGGGPSRGADVAGVGRVAVQMWRGWAESRCRCGRGGSSTAVRPRRRAGRHWATAPSVVFPGRLAHRTAARRALRVDAALDWWHRSFGDNELSPECLDGAQRWVGGSRPQALHLSSALSGVSRAHPPLLARAHMRAVARAHTRDTQSARRLGCLPCQTGSASTDAQWRGLDGLCAGARRSFLADDGISIPCEYALPPRS